MANLKSKMAMVLAASIIKNEPTNSKSTALTLAWIMVKRGDAVLLTFKKVDGSICRRVVSENWASYQEPKGGRKLTPGLTVFADLGKHAAGQNFIISTYNVLSIERLAA
ncbi:MAG: hypothetical protein ACRC3K_08335 [Plesiomonas sp.]